MMPKKMLLSSRKDPPRQLVLPVPSSSQHLTIKQILFHSPLPSPALPSILPRHGKKPPRLNTRRFLRYLSWLAVLTTLFVIFRQSDGTKQSLSNLLYESSNGRQYEIIAAEDLPSFASPVAVTDKHGTVKWTVSIPTGLEHPLPPTEYADICTHAEDVSGHVAESRGMSNRKQGYNHKDSNFVDLDKAQATGLLPLQALESHSGLAVCPRSLTYVLDAAEAGLGQTLLGLWMSYALAKQEDRTFFIDDTHFPYGNYTSLFSTSLETPDCQPPPFEHRTPCPHEAKHLIVNAATLRFTFGRSFQERYNTKEIYKMAREGYEALFRLRSEDSDYVKARTAEIRASVSDNDDNDGMVIGMHIRRGDRHPFEFQYQHGYIPPSEYMSAAQTLTKHQRNSIIALASDDADLYHHPDVKGTIRAQEQIRLASKKQLQEGGLGWEGGFFSNAFWSIGVPEHVVKEKYALSPQPTKAKEIHTGNVQSSLREIDDRDYRSHPTPEARQLREYIGRSYLLDLAVLAESDDVVCGVSSRGCRILGVMMGWDKLHGGHWHNVDGDHGWRALF